MRLLFLLVLAAGCAPKPVLFPNDFYKQSGKEQAQRDIADCQDQARGAAGPPPVFKDFVDACLIKKGYQPMGWR